MPETKTQLDLLWLLVIPISRERYFFVVQCGTEELVRLLWWTWWVEQMEKYTY